MILHEMYTVFCVLVSQILCKFKIMLKLKYPRAFDVDTYKHLLAQKRGLPKNGT